MRASAVASPQVGPLLHAPARLSPGRGGEENLFRPSPFTLYPLPFTLNSIRHAHMPVGRLLILMRDIQHLRFAEIIADDLQSDRMIVGAEPRGNRHARQPREI